MLFQAILIQLQQVVLFFKTDLQVTQGVFAGSQVRSGTVLVTAAIVCVCFSRTRHAACISITCFIAESSQRTQLRAAE